jgi:hypothetical protein
MVIFGVLAYFQRVALVFQIAFFKFNVSTFWIYAPRHPIGFLLALHPRKTTVAGMEYDDEIYLFKLLSRLVIACSLAGNVVDVVKSA